VKSFKKSVKTHNSPNKPHQRAPKSPGAHPNYQEKIKACRPTVEQKKSPDENASASRSSREALTRTHHNGEQQHSVMGQAKPSSALVAVLSVQGPSLGEQKAKQK
jgi:hypothetical protein